MRVLFVHQNFPGQYKHICAALARDPANTIVALACNARPLPKSVRVILYPAPKTPSTAHPIASDFDTKVAWGVAAAEAAAGLKAEGFEPDIICGHPGWGEMLFLRDVWPEARTLSFMEFFFRSFGSDFAFERPDRSRIDPQEIYRLRARNVPFLMAIESSDWCVSPTVFQWHFLPDFARARTSIIHEGVDTQMIRRNTEASVRLGRDNLVCRPGDEIVTFVNRNLEPYRGFHMFMRALPDILARRPLARAVIVGGDSVSYGPSPKDTTWRKVAMKEVAGRLDMSRVHFVGKVPYSVYLNLLQVSAAHIYLTYPFVLSWSMLEAMSAECLLIGSNTAPVTEVIDHERNGLLVDFFSPAQLADTVVRALESPERYRAMRAAARQTILERYDLRLCLPRQLELVADVAAGRTPRDKYIPEGAEPAAGVWRHDQAIRPPPL